MSDGKDKRRERKRDPRRPPGPTALDGGGGELDQGELAAAQDRDRPEGDEDEVVDAAADAAHADLDPPQRDQSGRSRRVQWLVALGQGRPRASVLEFLRWLKSRSEQRRGRDRGDEIIGLTRDVRRAQKALSDGTALFDDILDVRSADAQALSVEDAVDGTRSGDARVVLTLGRDPASDSLAVMDEEVQPVAERTSAPAALVPTDLDRHELDAGPVVLAVEPQRSHESLGRVGRLLADAHGLDMVLVFVAPDVLDEPEWQSRDELGERVQAARARAREALAAWAERADAGDAQQLVQFGDLNFVLRRTLRRLDASLLLCGTDGSSVLGRLEQPTPALQTARFTAHPVVLVPRHGDATGSA